MEIRYETYGIPQDYEKKSFTVTSVSSYKTSFVQFNTPYFVMYINNVLNNCQYIF